LDWELSGIEPMRVDRTLKASKIYDSRLWCMIEGQIGGQRGGMMGLIQKQMSKGSKMEVLEGWAKRKGQTEVPK
jgi:hypothetical protein